MHSSVELISDEFEITIQGRCASVADLLPDFGEQTRIGVIVRDDLGAVGASTLLTAAVTAFYDIQRAQSPDGFFCYADYFLFHTGRIRGNHAMLDVFPDHKEVVVDDDPESILRAVNDRGITHLIVPEWDPSNAVLGRETLSSAKQRLKGAILYGSDGRVTNPDVEIKGNEHVDFYVWATLKPLDYVEKCEAEGGDPRLIAWERSRLGEVDDTVAAEMLRDRERLKVSGRTTESFRRIPIDEALRLLSPNPATELG
jgi:hypothetical protein